MHCIEQDSLSRRRSIYSLGNTLGVSENCFIDTVAACLKYCPTPFNIQSARVVILLQKRHQMFWNMVWDSLQQKAPASKLISAKTKIDSFSAGYGTILFFEDKNALAQLKKSFPLYKKNMRIWCQQANGMLQYMVWQTLAENEVGASLQHYNELVEKEVINWLKLPKHWELVAQMPFGGIAKAASEKNFLPLSDRFLVLK